MDVLHNFEQFFFCHMNMKLLLGRSINTAGYKMQWHQITYLCHDLRYVQFLAASQHIVASREGIAPARVCHSAGGRPLQWEIPGLHQRDVWPDIFLGDALCCRAVRAFAMHIYSFRPTRAGHGCSHTHAESVVFVSEFPTPRRRFRGLTTQLNMALLVYSSRHPSLPP